VFRALFEHVRQQAKDRRDVCGLRLYVEQNNRLAQRAYERLGMGRAHYDIFELDWS
jgi:ribosomal protein S18 acetylase RimI-like enzyme